jgi:hypothetical protein
MQKAKILIFCTIFVANSVFCQNKSSFTGLKYTPAFQQNPLLHSGSTVNHEPFENKLTKSPVAPDFYPRGLGFFCKQEIKLEKLTKIPFRFRLGSVAQCDRMEGKPNSGY